MTTTVKTDHEQGIERLRDLLVKEDQVYCIVRHVAEVRS